MAETVTLDQLLGADGPESTGNPSLNQQDQGPEQVNGHPNGASAGETPDSSVEARIARLEELREQHGRQIDGARQEVDRWKTRYEEQEAVTRELATQLTNMLQTREQAPQTPATPAPRKISMREAMDKAYLENDYSLLEEYDRQQQSNEGSAPLTQADIQKMLDEREQQWRQQTQKASVSQQLQAELLRRHPDIQQNNDFANLTVQQYQALAQNPTTQYLFPPDPDGTYEITDPSNGSKYDIRILMQAANEAKAQLGGAPSTNPSPGGNPNYAAPSLGSSSSPSTPPVSNAPKIPRTMVDAGADALLRDPRVQRAMQAAGWGGNLKQQVNHMLEKLPDRVKQGWQ